MNHTWVFFLNTFWLSQHRDESLLFFPLQIVLFPSRVNKIAIMIELPNTENHVKDNKNQAFSCH